MIINLKIPTILEITSEDFFQICQENPELKLERNPQGEIIIMTPTGGETGRKNAELNFQLMLWNQEYQLGEVFDSSTGFRLPKGGERSPDVAWIKKERWQSLTPEEKEQFIPLCPDFVIELLSSSDQLKNAQMKLGEYLDNGCLLGWLINRQKQEVEIYRPGSSPELLIKPWRLRGEPVLPGFVLDLTKIWETY